MPLKEILHPYQWPTSFHDRKRGGQMPLEQPSENNRQSARYPIALKLQYKLRMNKKGLEYLGFGRTLNISSGGVLFEADCPLPARAPIEVALDWPYLLLDGVVTLKLVMRGIIIRSDAKAIAVKADHYEFRTAGAPFRKAMSDSGPRQSIIRLQNQRNQTVPEQGVVLQKQFCRRSRAHHRPLRSSQRYCGAR